MSQLEQKNDGHIRFQTIEFNEYISPVVHLKPEMTGDRYFVTIHPGRFPLEISKQTYILICSNKELMVA